MYAIHGNNICKKYRNGVQALKGFNLAVEKGEVFSLLGKNGAGKSTLINILTTFLTPSNGTIEILGKETCKNLSFIRSQIACVSQHNTIDTHLSLKENMLFQSRLYKIPKPDAIKRMKMLISAFELERYLKYPVSSYSGGVKRRLDIALNMMSKPEILFMDEPTVGMDIQSRMAMWSMINKIRDDFGTTIFLTTHYLEEADSLSDTICIMNDGKEVMQGTPFELKDYLKQDIIQIRFPTNKVARQNFPFIAEANLDNESRIDDSCIITYSKNSHSDFIKFCNLLLKNNCPFSGIEILLPSLEDIFLRLTNQKKGECS